jgi:hypothetical protein
MKIVKVIGTAAVFLLMGTPTSIHAQRDGQGDKREGKQAQPEKPQSEGRGGAQPQRSQHSEQRQQQPERTQQPQNQPQRAPQPRQQPQRVQQSQPQQPQRAPQQQGARQPTLPQRTQQQARTWQQQRGWQQQAGAWQAHDTWQQGRAQNWSSQHETWAQRGGYGGYYIPQDRFSLYFGASHFFRIHTRPIMYMGYPRFEYSGISFLLVDPWPENWSDNWYDSDDLYIDYDDGYYLYNRSYPYVRLAITVAL